MSILYCQLIFQLSQYLIIFLLILCRCQVGNSCISKNTHPADGTSCGKRDQGNLHKWCIDGRCVQVNQKDLHALFPVHGGWSEWGPWTSCSQTCGRELSVSERQCNNPEPQNGGQFCTSRRRQNGVFVSDKKYRLCNLASCSLPTHESIYFEHDEMCIRFTRSSNFRHVEDLTRPCILRCVNHQVSQKFREN